MPITAVRNPVWQDAAKTVLDVEVSLDNGATFVPYTAEPNGEIYNDALGGKFGAISLRAPVAPSTDALVRYARIAAKRIMEGGIVVNTGGQAVQVDTHPDALSGLSRNLQLGSLNPSQTFVWVQSPKTITLTAAQMQIVAKTTYAYEQACWATLSEIGKKITAGEITTQAQIDTYPWPKSS